MWFLPKISPTVDNGGKVVENLITLFQLLPIATKNSKLNLSLNITWNQKPETIMPTPDIILRLAENFHNNQQSYRNADFNETRTRQELIDPLFQVTKPLLFLLMIYICLVY